MTYLGPDKETAPEIVVIFYEMNTFLLCGTLIFMMFGWKKRRSFPTGEGVAHPVPHIV
jgi:hypothetical protein